MSCAFVFRPRRVLRTFDNGTVCEHRILSPDRQAGSHCGIVAPVSGALGVHGITQAAIGVLCMAPRYSPFGDNARTLVSCPDCPFLGRYQPGCMLLAMAMEELALAVHRRAGCRTGYFPRDRRAVSTCAQSPWPGRPGHSARLCYEVVDPRPCRPRRPDTVLGG